jgi:D-arabinose 1-dehydrogenase-like Zn-dependent alcohol dehydrogenase
MGACEVIDSQSSDVAQSVQQLTDGLGADCVIDCVGNEETMTYSFDALRHGGRLVVVGYTAQTYKLQGKPLAQNEKEIIGSRAGRPQDLVATVALVAGGKLESIVSETFPLEQANEALAYLRRGTAMGRVVLLTAAARR